MIFYLGIDYTMLSSSAQRKMYGGDAPEAMPSAQAFSYNERNPSAAGWGFLKNNVNIDRFFDSGVKAAAPAAAAAPSVMFVYNIGQQAPALMGGNESSYQDIVDSLKFVRSTEERGERETERETLLSQGDEWRRSSDRVFDWID